MESSAVVELSDVTIAPVTQFSKHSYYLEETAEGDVFKRDTNYLYYFLILKRKTATSNRYRRVGLGGATWKFWGSKEREIIEIE